MINFLLLFLVYGFLGWIVECSYIFFTTGVIQNRGFLKLPFLPIYAFGAVGIYYIGTYITDIKILFLLLSIVISTLLEYYSSWLLEKIFDIRWWDYSNYKFNLNGRVCLLNSILFGVLSYIIFYIVNPMLIIKFNEFSNDLKIIIIFILNSALFMDLGFTISKLLRMTKNELKELEDKMIEY